MQPLRPCESHPCGSNAHCRVHPDTGSAACICPPDYRGDPYVSCRPECVLNMDCPSHRTCVNNRCVDPCAGVCGVDALCRVANHMPICGCPERFTGDPYSLCRPIPAISKTLNSDLRPKLTLFQLPKETTKKIFNFNLSFDFWSVWVGFALVYSKIKHFTVRFCTAAPTTAPTVLERPCPPCQPNSKCQVIGSEAKCVCLPGYTGLGELGCRPDCLSNAECPSGQSCINRRCVDPCPGMCGSRAQCSVAGHIPFCACPVGYTGDPYSVRGCQIIPSKNIVLTGYKTSLPSFPKFPVIKYY